MPARRHARRHYSAPPERTTWTRVLHLEDVAAERLAEQLPVRWQVELQWGAWLDFPADQTRMLEKAWQSMAATVEIGTVEWPDRWTISFSAMLQINDWSGTL